jgi:hypothetical protein
VLIAAILLAVLLMILGTRLTRRDGAFDGDELRRLERLDERRLRDEGPPFD